jgi:hypothetical protein
MSQATSAPSHGYRRRKSEDGPITLISADPTQYDRDGRTHSLCKGDGQSLKPLLTRPSPARRHRIELHYHRSQNLGDFDALYRASRQPPLERRVKTP